MRSPNCILLALIFSLSACQFSIDDTDAKSHFQSRRAMVSNAGFSSNAITQSNGVAIEQNLASGSFTNPYNNDNTIYQPGKTWRYKLSIAKENSLHAVEISANGEWRLVPVQKAKSNRWKRVKELHMQVVDGLGPYSNDFNQTVVKYTYQFEGRGVDGNESFTGLIENDANVWVHPLRQDFFEILALNPYPFIQHPVEAGKRFNFNLPVYENWSNPEWKKWYGTLKNDCRYEIARRRSVELPFGSISAYAVVSNCENELGDTGLIAYFDEALGFVKMDYRNIDGSWLSLELLERPH